MSDVLTENGHLADFGKLIGCTEYGAYGISRQKNLIHV